MNSGLTLSLMTKCSLPCSLHSTKPFEVFQSCNLVVIWWIAHSTTGYPSTSLDCSQKWHCLENRGYTPKIDAVSRCHGNVLMKNMALIAKGHPLVVKHGLLENTLFKGEFPIETSILRGSPIATFDYTGGSILKMAHL